MLNITLEKRGEWDLNSLPFFHDRFDTKKIIVLSSLLPGTITLNIQLWSTRFWAIMITTTYNIEYQSLQNKEYGQLANYTRDY